MDDVSAVCGSKMVPFKKREKQTELTYNFSSWPVRARVCGSTESSCGPVWP